MVTIVRDRVRDLKKAGMTLDQVKAASPARGYTRRYGSDSAADDQHFVEAVYQSLRRRSVSAASPDLRRGCRRASRCFVSRCAAQNRGGPPQAPPTAKASAPIDLTGYWVAVVNEDWRYRMVTPAKGDYRGVPITQEALKIVNAWDPAADEKAGNQCKSYGAGGRDAAARAASMSPGRTTTRCASTPTPARRRGSFSSRRRRPRPDRRRGRASRSRGGSVQAAEIPRRARDR